jgi:hypothetical protein
LSVALAAPGGAWRESAAPDAAGAGTILLSGGAAGAVLAVDGVVYGSTADGTTWRALPVRCGSGTLRALALDPTGTYLVIGCGPASGAQVSLEFYGADSALDARPPDLRDLGGVVDADPASLAVGDAEHAVVGGAAVSYRSGSVWAKAQGAVGAPSGAVTFTGAATAVYLGPGAPPTLVRTAYGGRSWQPISLR